ncbi:uncharacterized protein N7515_009637 [Penicillium bovifimosum]|uniref:Uncharacterized protein n=1 Tax=Penicillium bovifimosum TaxID=126998 RepID=A0A9W9GK44_9EURO|nr:uncharacterized protein N7515_009637 [Penicillium bovifimosum]KAJ5121676.1 hypothetical protein N7515_009637 [Penicillium bovifimosum]
MTDTTAQPNQDVTSQSSICVIPAKEITPCRKEKIKSQSLVAMYKRAYHEDQESEGRPPTPTLFDRKSQDLQRKHQQTLNNKIKVFEYVLGDTPQVPDNTGNTETHTETHTERLKAFYRFKVLTSLLFCAQYVDNKDADSADRKVKDAMFIAQGQMSEDEILIAKCEFWHGRVEFLRGNMQLAHAHFLAANCCAMDPEEGVECMDLSFYLDVTRHGISEATRNARLLAHNEAIVAEIPFDKTANNSVSVETKRKRPIWTWKRALVEMDQLPLLRVRRPPTRAPSQLRISEERLAQELEKEHAKDHHVLGKTLAEELGFGSEDEFDSDYDSDTETRDDSEDEAYSEEGSDEGYVGSAHDATDEAAPDLPEVAEKSQAEETPTVATHAASNAARNPPPSPPPNPPRKIPNDQAMYDEPSPDSNRARFRIQCYQMGLTKSLNGKSYVRPEEPFVFGVPHEPTQQTKFTVGAFKVGLEKRARPMTIFPRQPGEIVMTPEEWGSIEKEAKEMIVTYDFLQWERNELLRVAVRGGVSWGDAY